MIDLGSELREAREAKGISLAEAEAATRIKGRYLKALETNDWAALPTRVQAQGFLRNYATYLGLEVNEIMARFAQTARPAPSALPVSPGSEAAVRTTTQDGAVFEPRDIDIDRVTSIPFDIIVGVGLALVVVILGFGLLQLISGGSDEAPVAITATPLLAPGATAGATDATGTGATPVSLTPTFDASMGNVQVSLEATEHVWVRVTVDGTKVLEGVLAPGAPQAWQGTQRIVLETANGAGLKAVVNGQPLETLGERGQVVTLAWGPSGPVTPPPTTAP